jgi:hypothetical protein
VKYTVLWKPVAESCLSELWTIGPDRQAVADAANFIDIVLKNDADKQGEARDATRRVLLVPPIAVLYKVEEQDRKVFVLDVWRP